MANIHRYIKGFILTPLRYPFYYLLFIFSLTVLLAFQVSQIPFDSSIEGFLNEENSSHKDYINFKKDFGLSEQIIVLIETEDLLENSFLHALKNFHEDLESTVPHVATVESLINTRHLKSADDNIQIDALLATIDDTIDSNYIKTALLNTPYYHGRIVNPELNATAVMIKLQPFIKNEDGDGFHNILIEDGVESLEKVEALISKHSESLGGNVIIGGTPYAVVELNKLLKHDFFLFTAIALVIITAFLYFSFRRFSAVAITLFVMVMSVTMTLSIMFIFRFPIQATSTILPSFIMVVSIGDSVHFLQSFFKSIDAGVERREAIEDAMKHTLVAMFYTTLTTSIGLLSFTASNIVPVYTFGLFSALGVWVAFLLTFICLPSALLLAPITYNPKGDVTQRYMGLTVSWIHFLKKHAAAIVSVSTLMSFVFIGLGTQLTLSHDSLKWFPEDHPVRKSVELVEDKMTGAMTVELLIESEEGGLLDSRFLQALDKWLQTKLDQQEGEVNIHSVSSLLDLLKEMNRAIGDGNYSVPDSSPLIAQYLLLLEVEGGSDIESYLTPDHQSLRITLLSSWEDAVVYTEFLENLRADFDNHFTGKQLTITGIAPLANTTMTEMLYSMFNSYVIAGVLVTLVMIILLNNLKLGAIMMLPNLLPILSILGVMYAVDIPVDLFTLLIGSIAIGLIVDDSVHFIHGFKKAFLQHNDVIVALQYTFIHAGRALFITTVTLASGFLVYLFSSLSNIQVFGLLISLCIVLALIADFVVAPAIILLAYKNKHTD